MQKLFNGAFIASVVCGMWCADFCYASQHGSGNTSDEDNQTVPYNKMGSGSSHGKADNWDTIPNTKKKHTSSQTGDTDNDDNWDMGTTEMEKFKKSLINLENINETTITSIKKEISQLEKAGVSKTDIIQILNEIAEANKENDFFDIDRFPELAEKRKNSSYSKPFNPNLTDNDLMPNWEKWSLCKWFAGYYFENTTAKDEFVAILGHKNDEKSEIYYRLHNKLHLKLQAEKFYKKQLDFAFQILGVKNNVLNESDSESDSDN